MSFVDLEDQLRNGFNPFQSNSSTSVESTSSMPTGIRLFVVKNSSINPQTDSQRERILFEEISSSNEIHNESNLSVHSIATNDEVSENNNEYSPNANAALDLSPIPQSVRLQGKPNISCNRLSFSLDVKPNQRDVYRSDQFSVRSENANGRIAHVQGLKTPNQKMLQVLPRLRIPSVYLQANITLHVTVVLEQSTASVRIWHKHPDKGFLPEGYDKDTKAINPIKFDLNPSRFTNNEEFLLNLQMVTKWNKSQRELEEVYRLKEKKAALLHPATHEKHSPRLLCVLQQDNEPIWETICLSDFIRSKKVSESRSSSATTGRASSSKRKRSKIDN